MGDIERSKVECDGGPYCQAPEHIHGCFAEGRTWMTEPKEVDRLRRQLAGAVVIDDAAVERAARALATDNEEAAAWDLYVETARLALHAAAEGQCAAPPRKEQP